MASDRQSEKGADEMATEKQEGVELDDEVLEDVSGGVVSPDDNNNNNNNNHLQ